MKGDCFQAAGRYLLDYPQTGMILVHGEVTGQGPIEGIKHAHAWLELDGIVYDKSNGRDIEIPVEIYYKIGKIDPLKTMWYTYDMLRKMIVQILKFGSVA